MGILIVDGKRRFATLGVESFEAYAARLQDNRARELGVRLPPLDDVDTGHPAPAEVNQNRWIVQCPDCHGAEYVWLSRPIMMCNGCLNARIGHRWRAVTLPENLDEITGVLQARTMPQTRNWNPGESVADLKAENLRHGEAL